MFLFNLVAKVFRTYVNALLWVILIGSIIGGFVGFGLVFADRGESFSIGFALLGLIAGGLAGFTFIVLFFGLIVNFLNMVANVEFITEYIKSNSGGNLTGSNLSNIAPLNNNIGETWTCKKCNEKNPIASSQCKGCGEYK